MAMPDGYKADAEVMGELTKLVNERGLDKETAEALAPIGAKIAQKAVEDINNSYAQVRAEWRDQVANDPVIGSVEAMHIAKKGLEAYGSPELSKLADETGLGDQPWTAQAEKRVYLAPRELAAITF